MRRAVPLLALALATAPLVHIALPAARGSEGRHASDKAERKRAEQDAIRKAVQRGDLVSLPRVIAIARARVPGEVVKIELEYEERAIQYEVKILTPSGRIREVEIDARSGSVIKVEDD